MMTGEAEQLREFFDYRNSDLGSRENVRRLVSIGDEALISIISIHADLLEISESLVEDGVSNIYKRLKKKLSYRNTLAWVAAALNVEDLKSRWTAIHYTDFSSDYLKLSSAMKKIRGILEKLTTTPSLGATEILELAEYMRIGGYLKNTNEMVHLKNVLADIMAGQNAHRLVPAFNELFRQTRIYKQFVFVCASSGTGKTQIPFTLCKSMPLLYFLESPTALDQNIYTPFAELSSAFHKVCIDDIGRLTSLFPDFVTNHYRMIDFKGQILDVPLMSVGFLIAAIKYTVRNMVANSEIPEKSGNWLYAQLDVNPFYCQYELMSITEFRKEIVNLREAYPKLLEMVPVIFLDECETSDNRMVFVFKRNLIRRLGLVPILMGTDSKVHNIIGKAGKKQGSRGTGDAWCFVVSKLPLYPVKMMDEEIKKIRKVLDQSDINQQEKKVRRELIDAVKDCLQKERPWFVATALKRFADSVGNPDLSLTNVVFGIVQGIKLSFVERKRIITGYRLGQLLFAQHRYKPNESKIHPDVQPAFIHSHLAYFGIKTSNQPQDPGMDDMITLRIDDLGFLNYVDKNGDAFEMVAASYFASFDSQPLSSLAFTVEQASMKLTALPNLLSRHDRMSIYDALRDIKTCGEFKPSHIYVDKKFDGFELEAVSRCALVYTLSRNGFQGIGFFNWLSYYAAEFRHGAYKPIEFNFDAALKRMLKNVKLPFCGPVSEEWHQGLRDFLEKRCGAFIGMIHETENSEGIDGKVTIKNGEQYVLQLECKNHRKNVGSPLLLEIVENFKREPCKLNFIVAREYVDFASMATYLKNQKLKRVAVIRFEASRLSLTSKIVYGELRDADWIVFLLCTKDIQGLKRE